MTHIFIDKEDDYFRLVAKGHAGYAVAGEDIVCAAISALVQTLMYHMEKITEDYECHVKSGDVMIYGKGVQAVRAFEVIETGLRIIAEDYPDYIFVHCEGCPRIDEENLK